MTLFAAAFSTPPGKTDQWRRWMGELHGPRNAEYRESRIQMGVRERTFPQQMPHGDRVIVTRGGGTPAQAFATFTQRTDSFSEWFLTQVQAIHGIDLRQPTPGPPPELVIDSQV